MGVDSSGNGKGWRAADGSFDTEEWRHKGDSRRDPQGLFLENEGAAVLAQEMSDPLVPGVDQGWQIRKTGPRSGPSAKCWRFAAEMAICLRFDHGAASNRS